MATAKEFQDAAREAAQITHLLAGERLAVLAATPNLDPEVAIKIFNATKDVAQAVPEKKTDPFANLPVFHIHMHNGRIGGSGAVTPALELADVIEAFELEGMSPTEPMLAMSHINEEAMSGLEELEL